MYPNSLSFQAQVSQSQRLDIIEHPRPRLRALETNSYRRPTKHESMPLVHPRLPLSHGRIVPPLEGA